jgi:hypothetical protein
MKTEHPVATVFHTAGTAGTIIVPLAAIYFNYLARYTERFDFLFFIFWPVCIISSFHLLQDSSRTRPYIGFVVAIIFGFLFFATPRVIQ